MKSVDIPFAGELLFTVKIPSDKDCCRKDSVIAYQLSGDNLYLLTDVSAGNNPVMMLATVLEDDPDVFEQLKRFEGRSLLRVECPEEKKHIMQLALLTYSSSVVLSNPLLIVIDEAVGNWIREKGWTFERAVREFSSWFIWKDKEGPACFSIGIENLQLFSRSYVMNVKKSAVSGYLHVVDIQPRRNTPHGLIQILRGDIRFTDQKAVRADLIRQGDEIYQALIKDNSELLKLWGAYNDCEKQLALKNAREMGIFNYSRVTIDGGRLVFHAKDGLVDGAFIQEDMFYEAISAADYTEDIYSQTNTSAVLVGTNPDRSCTNTPSLSIAPDDSDFSVYNRVPSPGVLYPSLRGSVVQANRRRTAQERIHVGNCQIPQLKILLQSGAVIGDSRKHRAPVTDQLEKRMFGSGSGRHFNDRQKAAINAAINTPDMAIIQGPPGTGKTQVIKSIIERISELEKGKARILITSTQHDAVDNAIDRMSYNGVPVNRAVGRRRETSSVSPVYEYVDQMIDNCSRWLGKHESERKNYAPVFSALQDFRQDRSSKAAEALRQMMTEEGFSAQAFIALDAVLHDADQSSAFPDDLEAFRRHMDDQCLTQQDFLSGGAEKLRLLIRFIRNELMEPELVPDYWRTLSRVTGPSDELDRMLAQFALDLEGIRKDKGLDRKSEPSQELLDNLDRLVRQEIAVRIDRAAQADPRSVLIREFMQELTGMSNVKNLIRTYSKINAATCQQSASARISDTMKGFDDEYDYVIVDEAARSNPLDLMIPMVMGRKIILVGDQMQLPHMLEEDVVARVVKDHDDDPTVKELLKESLFVRLFNSMKENDDKDPSAVRRVVMLNTQFRMHPMISDLVSRQFYEKEDGSEGLVSGVSPESRRSHIPRYGDSALAWIDLRADNGFAHEGPRGSASRSRFRTCEIDELKKRLAEIILAVPDAERTVSEAEGKQYKYTIGIITFYKDQMKRIADMINKEYPDQADRIQVGTVDAFQGKEFDVVILSTVRSNNRKEIGFLEDKNRMCVAFSRAKRLLVVIGDSDTVTVFEPLRELYRICKEGEGYYESVRA